MLQHERTDKSLKIRNPSHSWTSSSSTGTRGCKQQEKIGVSLGIGVQGVVPVSCSGEAAEQGVGGFEIKFLSRSMKISATGRSIGGRSEGEREAIADSVCKGGDRCLVRGKPVFKYVKAR